MSDCLNRFAVTANARAVVVLNPPAPGRLLSRDEAVNLAAWLLVGLELAGAPDVLDARDHVADVLGLAEKIRGGA